MVYNKHTILVRCRPGVYSWLLIAIFIVSGALCFWFNAHAPQPRDIGLFPTGVLLCSAALPLMLYMLFARLRVDDTGLHWLGMRGWQTVLWEEITDYYRERRPGTARTMPYLATIIVTAKQKFLLSDASWTNLAALRECVQKRAKLAASSSWENRDFSGY